MKTIVYNDINTTENKFFLEIGKVRVYFSSLFNLNRFKEKYKSYIEEETLKLENKYHVKIVANYYFMIAIYKKIEKRGFRIENNITGALVSKNCTFLIEL